MESEKSLDLDKKKGWFGNTDEGVEYRRDQYTMDGAPVLEVDSARGKSMQKPECIAADAGARSQGAVVLSPLVSLCCICFIYVGWLAGGWALLLGQNRFW